MEYHFDRPIDRRNTDSMKWNVAEGELPMWVADMDFQTAPEIIDALRERTEHGIFGYTDLNEQWYEAYQSWWERRHHFPIKKSWLIFSSGVIPTLSSCVRRLTEPNESVVVLTPVYNTFFNSIVNNGARVLECPLDSVDDTYVINFERLERALSNAQTSLLIFCNPHNPTGTIWDRETILRVGELAHQYGVTVISDEIHCDLCDPGTEYVPFASASELCADISITCVAPTKTFNMAGLQTSAVIIKNPVLRHKIWRRLNTDECGEPNAYAVTAAVAAFTKGEAWLDALRSYLYENKCLVRSYFAKELPNVRVMSGPATYLLWLDLRAYGLNSKELQRTVRQKTGLYLSAGSIYGEAGDGFLRMNIACPQAAVRDGVERLAAALRELPVSDAQ